jgi:hypothetical protein
VVENYNGVNDYISFGKRGEMASNRREEQELAMLCLHILQSSLGFINLLMIQDTLATPEWSGTLTDEDLRGLNPLFHTKVQSRRNAQAAKRFLGKLLRGLRYVPRVLVTDKLASYGVAHRELMASVTHRQSRYLNNRAENSHQPTRQRERAMKRFKSVRHAQRFLSAFSGISPHFRPRRHRLSAAQWRTEMADRFAIWHEVTALDTAA